MRVDPKTWAIALGVALLAGSGALYATRPASPSAAAGSTLVGRDQLSTQLPDPVTADEIGYEIPRDRIKAIDAPVFVTAAQAGYLPDQVPVLGVADDTEAKAYPVPLMSRVEIVNDSIGGRAIAVTW